MAWRAWTKFSKLKETLSASSLEALQPLAAPAILSSQCPCCHLSAAYLILFRCGVITCAIGLINCGFKRAAHISVCKQGRLASFSLLSLNLTPHISLAAGWHAQYTVTAMHVLTPDNNACPDTVINTYASNDYPLERAQLQ